MKSLERPERRLRALLLLVSCCAGGSALADTHVVTHAGDSGAGSLRQAMLDALASAQASTISFAETADGVITLASPLPELLASGGALEIIGDGAADTIISGAGAHRPFTGAPGAVLTLRRLGVRDGRAGGASLNGGAILFSGQSLALDGVDLSGNAAPFGTGGAIFASAAVTIENSVLAANRANMGGAFEVWDGPLLVSNTTVAGTIGDNTTIVFGGGPAARARLVNATVVGNQARGIRLRMNATLSISNSLVSGNGGHDLGVVDSASVELATSLNNVIGVLSGTGLADGVNGNRIGVTDALVGPLGHHGGPTRTVALLPGSAALDAGTTVGGDVPAFDQRGLARIGAPDAGAFESRGFSLARSGGDGQSAVVGTAFTEPLVVQVQALGNGEPVEGGQVVFAAPDGGATAVLAPTVATLDADGRAATTATANSVVGGPYTVTATLLAGDGSLPQADFSLTNVSGNCAAFVFPYSLSGTDNAARVSELRQAIECANANATDDAIDLAGHTLVFADGPYADANGANALPIVATPLTLANGALERTTEAPVFRFLDVADGGDLTARDLRLRRGMSDSEGGAIRADGTLMLRRCMFEDNRAALRGGALASHAMTTIVASRFERNAAIDGAAIAGGDGDAIAGGDLTLAVNSRFEDNGDGDSRSVIWNKSYFAMVGSLVAGNQLSAAGSSLMAFHDDTAVAEMRNVTLAGNAVQGALLSWATANVQLHNAIVWDNAYGSLGQVSPTHSILPGAPAANGNLSRPPGFVGSPGDYRIGAGSPAIDAGDNNYGFLDAFDVDEDGDTGEMLPDLDLDPRPLDDAGVVDSGNGQAPLIDIGAYEYQGDSVMAGITVTPTGGLVTSEGGGTAQFTLVLDRYPAADVIVQLSSSDTTEGTVAPASMTFTQANWNQPRTATVTGADDAIIDGDQEYAIATGPASSADAAYDGLDAPDVQVLNEDDEAPTHRLGGTVVGLRGGGLVLSLDAVETLPIAGDGSFAFATMLAPGEPYAVTVATQPDDPAQACVVVNGSGTMAAVDIDNVVVNCGAAVTHSVGGTVDGLADGSLTLQLNGSGDLALSEDGGYVFLPRLVDGAGYVVTIRTQPQGQLCTLANAVGTVQGADVADVDVACAPLQANLHLGVDDGHAFARYGRMRDYFVTLGNSGNAAAGGVAVTATFSAAFDVANVHWQCVDGGGGASCADAGSGGFSDSATVPANGSVTWIVSVPVLGGSHEPDATFTVAAAPRAGVGLADASDTDVLVLFRDGHDVPYGDGTQGDTKRLVLREESSLVVEWPPAQGAGIRLVHVLETPDGIVELQRLNLRGMDFVRLLGTDATGRQRASAWAPVTAGARLVAGHVAGAAGDAGIVLLEGAVRPLALPPGTHDNNGDFE